MTKGMFDYIIGDDSKLTKIMYKVTTADDSAMAVCGCAKNITICLANQQFTIDVIVVKRLGADDIILGRDFLTKYDVLVDLSRNTITIRNPKLDYTIKTMYRESTPMTTYKAHAAKHQELPNDSITKVTFQLEKKQKTNAHGKGKWLAYVDRDKDQSLLRRGIAVPTALVTIEDKKTDIPLLSIKEEDTDVTKIKPGKTSTLTIRPVTVEYLREWIDQMAAVDPAPSIKAEFEKDGSIKRISVASNESEITLPSYLASSEIPVEAETTVTPFLTKPKMDHLDKILNAEERKELDDLCEEFKDLFSKDKTDIGLTTLETHNIELLPDAKPFREGLRRMCDQKRKAADEQIEALRKAGMIVPSRSPFASAIVLVKKGDNTMRFCVDFRRLNDITKKDAYPLPRMDETIGALGSATLYSAFDMGSAFWQVPLNKQSQEMTAFATPQGLFEWIRMPFGLCNATATFQRLMAKALQRICQRYGNLVLCYVDDILIASTTVREHLDRIREVFQCLRDAGLKLKAQKCKLFDTQIKFLGRKIDANGIRPDPDNIKKVLEWKTPTNKDQLGHILGFANYYREFIKGYADIIAPLQHMKKDKVPFLWNEITQKAFDDIKKALTSDPVLAMPVEKGDYVLDTDASDVAIAGILHQWQDVDGKPKLKVLAYGSKVLSTTQRHYGAAKLEMLGVLTFIEKFRNFLSGKKFTLRCDNKALSWLKTYAIQDNPMAARWIARLEGFNFDLIHRLRGKHYNADALTKRTNDFEKRDEDRKNPPTDIKFSFLSQEDMSKIPELEEVDKLPRQNDDPEVIEDDKEIKLVRMKEQYDTNHLAGEQNGDRAISIFKTMMTDNIRPQTLEFGKLFNHLDKAEKRWFNKNRNKLHINARDILTLLREDGDERNAAIVIPTSIIQQILRKTHDALGHESEKKVFARAATRFTWPKMRADITRYCEACDDCQRSKHSHRKRITKMKPIVSTRPNEILEIDFLKLCKANTGETGILMMVDHFTKYCVAVPVQEMDTRAAIDAVWIHWVTRFGVPEMIQSDQGSQFESNLFQELMTVLDCKKAHSTPYHPQTQGLVERQNQTMIKMIRVACANQKDWPMILPNAVMAYNTSVHTSIGITPHKMMHGQEMRTPLSLLFKEFNLPVWRSYDKYIRRKVLSLTACYSLARGRMDLAQRRACRNHDKRISGHGRLSLGEYAMIFVDAITKKTHVKKLEPRWRGPYKVIKVYRNGQGYKLRTPKGLIKTHFERTRPYIAKYCDFFADKDGEIHYLEDEVGQHKTEILPEYYEPAFEDEGSNASSDEELTEPTIPRRYQLRPQDREMNYNENYIAQTPADGQSQTAIATQHQQHDQQAISTSQTVSRNTETLIKQPRVLLERLPEQATQTENEAQSEAQAENSFSDMDSMVAFWSDFSEKYRDTPTLVRWQPGKETEVIKQPTVLLERLPEQVIRTDNATRVNFSFTDIDNQHARWAQSNPEIPIKEQPNSDTEQTPETIKQPMVLLERLKTEDNQPHADNNSQRQFRPLQDAGCDDSSKDIESMRQTNQAETDAQKPAQTKDLTEQRGTDSF